MAGDGKAAPWAKACGEQIQRTRKQKKMTRPQLERAIMEVMRRANPRTYQNDPLYKKINVGWITRLEKGTIVKVTRQMLELVCAGMNCTDHERSSVMQLADRNFLADKNGELSLAASLFERAIALLYNEPSVRTILEMRVPDQDKAKIEQLSAEDLLKILMELIELVRNKLRRSASKNTSERR